ncbi:DUF6404 family protein [Collimonas sp.]|jgi:hypothetical protein|uniref:DUF6404 family protein n=1 Tax=Collimonas sp. TaxID=1963772 RepID=UPI002B74C85F|nr:DUF6404 family protein [Collimonas sp.]HWW05733.1 DUF6404 family protein [Collimonas sp.]
MPFKEKHSAALSFLASKGIWRSNYAPPLFQFLWLLGVKMPPPHFSSFFVNFIFFGIFFGGAWGRVSLGFKQADEEEQSLIAMVLGAVFSGLFFGLGMAAHYRHSSRRYGVPRWPNFKSETSK